MITVIGKKGVTFSHQQDFLDVEACECGGTADLGFVAYEETKEDSHICDLFENKPELKTLWLHDAVAVAVYFCHKCLKPTAKFNQA